MSAARRVGAHATDAEWWAFAAYVRVAAFETESQMVTAEACAIANEVPAFNEHRYPNYVGIAPPSPVAETTWEML